MSNQNSSNVTPSLNNGLPASSIATTTSSVLDNVGSFVEGATNRVSELGDQASKALDSASDTLSDSLGAEEPVAEEPVINSSDNTITNPPPTMSTDSLDNIPPPSQDTFGPSPTKRSRCRNGTRKDKDGNCQPKKPKQPKHTTHKRRSTKVHIMTTKFHELKLENNILIRRQKKAINLTKKLMNYLTLQ
jgi:hypothetical protein